MKNNTIFDKRLKDLVQNLKKDDYFNLAKFDMKEDIYFSNETDIRKYEAEKLKRIKRAKQYLRLAGIDYDWFIKQDELDRARIIVNIS